jgi:nicotinate-nucleotide adenylyltransferase
MSEKRDLWVPLLLFLGGLGVAAWNGMDGDWVRAALGVAVGTAGGGGSLYLLLKQGPARSAALAATGFLLLGVVSPPAKGDLHAILPWALVGLSLAFHAKRLPPAMRRALLVLAAVFAVGAVLAVLDVAGLRRTTMLMAAGALACTVQFWTSRERPEEGPPPGPIVAVFGGSFDPFHRGHRAIAEAVLKVASRLLVVVAGTPPHKEGTREMTPFHHRVAMARLGVEGLARTEVLELEGKRAGPSYTVDTLEALRKTLPPDTRFRFVLGADMLQDFPLWHDWEGILERASLLVAGRPGFDEEPPPEFEGRNAPIERLDIPSVDVSSTDLRRRIAGGEEIGERLSPAVAAYVRDHGLYRAAPAAESEPLPTEA